MTDQFFTFYHLLLIIFIETSIVTVCARAFFSSEMAFRSETDHLWSLHYCCVELCSSDGDLSCLFVQAGSYRRKWTSHRQRASLMEPCQKASQTYHTRWLRSASPLCNNTHKRRAKIHWARPAQLQVSQYNTSPLRVYLVMELPRDKAAAAERLCYSTYSRLYGNDTANVLCRNTRWDNRGLKVMRGVLDLYCTVSYTNCSGCTSVVFYIETPLLMLETLNASLPLITETEHQK